MKKKKLAAFRRDQPDLPRQFESSSDVEGILISAESVTIEGQHLTALERPGLRIGSFQAEGCVFEGIRLPDGLFSSSCGGMFDSSGAT